MPIDKNEIENQKRNAAIEHGRRIQEEQERNARNLREDGEKLADAAKRSCFPAGTKVLTSTGYVCIEGVKPGHYVYAYDNKMEHVVPALVVRRCEYPPSPILVVTLSNGTQIRTTGHHRFLVNGDPKQASHLVEGDLIRHVSGEFAVVLVRVSTFDEPVYNLFVATSHSFLAEGFVAFSFTSTPKISGLLCDVAGVLLAAIARASKLRQRLPLPQE